MCTEWSQNNSKKQSLGIILYQPVWKKWCSRGYTYFLLQLFLNLYYLALNSEKNGFFYKALNKWMLNLFWLLVQFIMSFFTCRVLIKIYVIWTGKTTKSFILCVIFIQKLFQMKILATPLNYALRNFFIILMLV